MSEADNRGAHREAVDWHLRWRQGRIGFHRSAPHPALLRWWERLSPPAGECVLVPLCGKSLDMRWLSLRGHRVLGVELSPLAIEAFIAEEDRGVERYQQSGLPCTRQGAIELLCGDFFHLDAQPVGGYGALLDRAALVALPPPARRRYAHRLAELMVPGATGLLVTLSHESAGGPPFSVDHAEVEALFKRNFELTLLESAPAEDGLPESIWQLVRKTPGY